LYTKLFVRIEPLYKGQLQLWLIQYLLTAFTVAAATYETTVKQATAEGEFH